MPMPDNCPLLTADYASWCPASMLNIDLGPIKCSSQCPLHEMCVHTAGQMSKANVPGDHSLFWQHAEHHTA